SSNDHYYIVHTKKIRACSGDCENVKLEFTILCALCVFAVRYLERETSMQHEITLTVNNKTYTRTVEPRLLLSDFLRHELGLTGTHVGCEHGVCGACTILLDGVPVRSCLTFAVQANGHEVMTVEGLSDDPSDLHPLQESFWEAHGLQCGFCTPGFLMTLVPFLEENPN